MIDAKDLRIGNWVMIENHPHKIAWFKPNDNSVDITDNYIIGFYKNGTVYEIDSTDPFDPIPLTMDILKNTNVEPDNDRCDSFKIGGIFFRRVDRMSDDRRNGYAIKVISSSDGQVYAFNNPVKYLHQLQNTYYSLTGTELEIKL